MINLDAIPDRHSEAKEYFEKNYSAYTINTVQAGRFVKVKDDGIYTFGYDIDDGVNIIYDRDGNEFLEFFLI